MVHLRRPQLHVLPVRELPQRHSRRLQGMRHRAERVRILTGTDMQDNMWARLRDSGPCASLIHAT